MKKNVMLGVLMIWILSIGSFGYEYEYIQQISVYNNSNENVIPEGYPVCISIDLNKLIKEGKISCFRNVMILYEMSGEMQEIPLFLDANKEVSAEEKIWFRLKESINIDSQTTKYFLVYSTETFSSQDNSIHLASGSENNKWIFSGDFNDWEEFRSDNEQNLEWGNLEDVLYVFDPTDELNANGKKGYRFESPLNISMVSFSGIQFFNTENERLKLNSGWDRLWETDELVSGTTNEFNVRNLDVNVLGHDLTFMQYVITPFNNSEKNYFTINRVAIAFKDPPTTQLLGEVRIGGISVYKYYRKIQIENTSPEYNIPAGYPVVAELNTIDLIEQIKVQEDCKDLRVFYYAKNESNCIQVERLIINPDSKKTKIWFRIFENISPLSKGEYYLFYSPESKITLAQELNLPFACDSDNGIRVYRDDFGGFEKIENKEGWNLENNYNLLIETKINTGVYGFGGFMSYQPMGVYDLIFSGKTNDLGEFLEAEITDLNGNVEYEFISEGMNYYTDEIVPFNSDEKRYIKFKVRVSTPGTVFESEKGLYLSEISFDLIYPPIITISEEEYINTFFEKEQEAEVFNYSRDLNVVNNCIERNNEEIKLIIECNPGDNISIEVYEITGKKICTIFNQQIETSKKELFYNPTDLKSGIYIIICRIGKKIIKKHFIKIN